MQPDEESRTSPFTEAELEFLADGPKLARVATVGRDGTPHVVPSGWEFDPATSTFVLGGMELERTKKFRDAQRTGRIALVVDEVLPPWRPRGIEVRGRAQTKAPPGALIRVQPDRIVSWGIESERIGERHSRSV